MFVTKVILVIILAVAVAAAGLPVYAGSVCRAGMHCPNCPDKPDNQKQQGNKCCGDIGCVISCSSVGSMNMLIAMNAMLAPLVYTADAVRPADDNITSLFFQTPKRPPKHFS